MATGCAVSVMRVRAGGPVPPRWGECMEIPGRAFPGEGHRLMTGKRLSTRPADRAERLRRYSELRDQGMTRGQAAQEVGVDYLGAGAHI